MAEQATTDSLKHQLACVIEDWFEDETPGSALVERIVGMFEHVAWWIPQRDHFAALQTRCHPGWRHARQQPAALRRPNGEVSDG